MKQTYTTTPQRITPTIPSRPEDLEFDDLLRRLWMPSDKRASEYAKGLTRKDRMERDERTAGKYLVRDPNAETKLREASSTEISTATMFFPGGSTGQEPKGIAGSLRHVTRIVGQEELVALGHNGGRKAAYAHGVRCRASNARFRKMFVTPLLLPQLKEIKKIMATEGSYWQLSQSGLSDIMDKSASYSVGFWMNISFQFAKHYLEKAVIVAVLHAQGKVGEKQYKNMLASIKEQFVKHLAEKKAYEAVEALAEYDQILALFEPMTAAEIAAIKVNSGLTGLVELVEENKKAIELRIEHKENQDLLAAIARMQQQRPLYITGLCVTASKGDMELASRAMEGRGVIVIAAKGLSDLVMTVQLEEQGVLASEEMLEKIAEHGYAVAYWSSEKEKCQGATVLVGAEKWDCKARTQGHGLNSLAETLQQLPEAISQAIEQAHANSPKQAFNKLVGQSCAVDVSKCYEENLDNPELAEERKGAFKALVEEHAREVFQKEQELQAKREPYSHQQAAAAQGNEDRSRQK